ncbi:hypothetical protein Tco_0714199 [Tanacetum coccineum]
MLLWASISAATGISDLEQVLQQKTFTRLEASTSGSLKKHGDERDNLHGITTPMVTSREIVVWTEDEADYPYFRSPPLKSRPWLGMDGATSDTIEETKPFHASLPAINHCICLENYGYFKCPLATAISVCLYYPDSHDVKCRSWRRSRGESYGKGLGGEEEGKRCVVTCFLEDGKSARNKLIKVGDVKSRVDGGRVGNNRNTVLKKDSRGDRGRGLGRDPPRLRMLTVDPLVEGLSKGGSGGGCGIYDDCELLLTELCRNDRGGGGGVGAPVSGAVLVLEPELRRGGAGWRLELELERLVEEEEFTPMDLDSVPFLRVTEKVKGMSKGGSGGGCGIYDDFELLLTELCRGGSGEKQMVVLMPVPVLELEPEQLELELELERILRGGSGGGKHDDSEKGVVDVKTEIALDVVGEEVVGLGKGRDGNEHVQRILIIFRPPYVEAST